jgi:hypothetical protein
MVEKHMKQKKNISLKDISDEIGYEASFVPKDKEPVSDSVQSNMVA